MATLSSILTWRIPWTEETGGYSPCGCKDSDMTKQLSMCIYIHPGGGNGNPVQYSCLENPHGQTEELGRLQSMGHKELDMTERLSTSIYMYI